MRIWKYKIYVRDGLQILRVPGVAESKVVAARMSPFAPHIIDIWIEIIPDSEKGDLEFRVFGTGHEVTLTPDRQTVHTATVFSDVHELVWHIYQLHEVKR